MDKKTELHKTALGYASMLSIVVWQAVALEGAKADPETLAKAEAALASGDVSLGIYICKKGDGLKVTASVIPNGLGNPLPDPRFECEGPMIFSRAQLAALNTEDAPAEPRTLN